MNDITFVACCTFARLLDMKLALIVALLNNDVLSLPSLVSICKVNSCTFTAGVATDFVLKPSNLISASKISQCLGSTLIPISQFTKRLKIDRLAVVVWTKNRSLLENQLLAGLRFCPCPLHRFCNEDEVVAVNESTHLAFTSLCHLKRVPGTC